MQFDDQIRFPKDVRIEDIILVCHTKQGISLINIFSELNVYEDMYSNTLSGDVTVVDGTNLPSNAEITGQDKILFSFYTPGPNPQRISLLMSVYRVSERVMENDKKQVFTIYFTSREQIFDNMRSISKAFDGLQHDFVRDIVKESYGLNSDRTVVFDRTKFETTCVVPRWNPFKAIQWITQRSVCADNDMPDMMFWESIDGYMFKSINKMMSVPVKENYIYRPAGHHNLSVGMAAYPNMGQDFINIEHLALKAPHNVLDNIESGLYAQKMIRYDIATGSLTEDTFNYLDYYDKAPNHLGRGKLIQVTPNLDEIKLFEEYDSLVNIIPEHSHLFKAEVEDTKKYPEWLMWRQSLMQQYNSVRAQIVVPGDTSRRVGDVIELFIPSPEPFVDDQYMPDKYFSGKYMICSIRHHVQRDKHQMIIEAFKDGLDQPLTDQNETQ